MAQLITGLDAARVGENVARVREEVAAAARGAGRDPADVELLAAVKYVALEGLSVLAEAGLTLLGANRAQELERKVAAYPGTFTWDFIGALQSRRVSQIAAHVRCVHSLASDSAARRIARHADSRVAEVLVEVDIAGEASKSGLAPAELDAFLERCAKLGVAVSGLMTMPPPVSDPERSRPHFAALRALADHRGLRRLSMGTSQDYVVAVQEGATIVRLGHILYR